MVFLVFFVLFCASVHATVMAASGSWAQAQGGSRGIAPEAQGSRTVRLMMVVARREAGGATGPTRAADVVPSVKDRW